MTGHDNPPIRVVAAVLVRNGRLLAAQRARGARQAMLWELPGGKVEPGESDPEALARELDEELGVQVQVGQEISRTVHVYPHATIELIALACSLDQGEPEAREHHALQWVDADDLTQLNWAPADAKMMPDVQALLS